MELLDADSRERFRKIVIVQTYQNLFERRGIFVESVGLQADRTKFRFYTPVDERYLGPFNAEFRWTAPDWMRAREFPTFGIPKNKMFRLEERKPGTPPHPKLGTNVR